VPVPGQDREVFNLCLRVEHPIERVGVVRRHRFQKKSMTLIDREEDHPLPGDAAGNIVCGRLGQPQPLGPP